MAVTVVHPTDTVETEMVTDYYLECLTRNEPQELIHLKDHLFVAFKFLVPMHLVCSVAILLSRWTKSNNKKSYWYNLLDMMTIPLYQLAIYQAYY